MSLGRSIAADSCISYTSTAVMQILDLAASVLVIFTSPVVPHHPCSQHCRKGRLATPRPLHRSEKICW